MTSIISFTRTTIGTLYSNEFTSTDGTTKIIIQSTPAWNLNTATGNLDAPPNAGLAWKGLAVAPAVNSDQYIIIRGKSDTVTSIISSIGAAVRYTTGKNGYIVRFDVGAANAFRIYRHDAGAETQLATTDFTCVAGTYYVAKLLVKGSALTGILTDTISSVSLTATDATYSAAQNGGIFSYVGAPAGYDNHFDSIYILSGSVITVNGLFDGQKVNFYSGAAKASTGLSVTGTCSVDTINTPLAGSFFDTYEVTDTDGVTIISRLSQNIFPGDVFTASVTQTPLKNPPVIEPMTVARPSLMFYTKKRAYN